MEKTVEYYMSLPYTRELIKEPEGGWFIRIKELPGCMSQGDTVEDAMTMIEDAMCGWLDVSLEDGDEIPEPKLDEDYSGKFVVRVPRSLHRQLAETAEREGVSLNQFINVALARAVERTATCISYTTVEKQPALAVSEKKAKLQAKKKKKI
jgi:antitoxin HicB